MAKATKRDTAQRAIPANCPAFAMARQIDRAGKAERQLDDAEISARNNDALVTCHRRITEAVKDWRYERETALSALALTEAVSLEGALAKAFMAFSVLYSEAEDPITDLHERDKHLFLARRLMGDFRKVIEAKMGLDVSVLGTASWYVPDHEPQARMAETAALCEAAAA